MIVEKALSEEEVIIDEMNYLWARDLILVTLDGDGRGGDRSGTGDGEYNDGCEYGDGLGDGGKENRAYEY